jgi:hypothetical protein
VYNDKQTELLGDSVVINGNPCKLRITPGISMSGKWKKRLLMAVAGTSTENLVTVR